MRTCCAASNRSPTAPKGSRRAGASKEAGNKQVKMWSARACLLASDMAMNNTTIALSDNLLIQ